MTRTARRSCADTTRADSHPARPNHAPSFLGPNRPQPACKGRGNLWDNYIHGERPTDREQRHALAIAICVTCPEHDRCEPLDGDEGIYGGVLHDPKQRCNSCGKPLPENQDYANLYKYCTQTCRADANAARKRARRAAARQKAAAA